MSKKKKKGAAAPAPAPASAATAGPAPEAPPQPGGEPEAAPPDAGQAAEPRPAGPRKVEPKHHAKAALEPKLAPDPVEVAAKRAADWFRDNAQLVAAAALVLIVGIVFVSWRRDAARARDRLAWREFDRAAGGAAPPTVERLNEVLDLFRGTSAEPFIILAIGDRHFAAGATAGQERAAEAYERVLQDHGDNPEAVWLARRSLEAAKKALTFDPAKHAAERGKKAEWARAEPRAPATGSSPSE